MLIKTAYSLGFSGVYFLPLTKLSFWREEALRRGVGASLEYDLAAAYPGKSSVMLTVWPYLPFSPEERISAYYLASDRCYRAGNALISAAAGSGEALYRANVPLRALSLSHGIGTKGRCGLLSIPPYGSRIVLSAFVTALPPLEFDPPAPDICPEDCTACVDCCPVSAISANLDVRRCMRFYMDGALHPEWVMEKQRWFLGCEGCLFACRKNAALPVSAPDPAVREAFDIKRLICGDCTAARALVGRNISSNGKLTCEAIAFGAREHMYENEIRRALLSPFEAVRSTAQWALTRYFKEK